MNSYEYLMDISIMNKQPIAHTVWDSSRCPPTSVNRMDTINSVAQPEACRSGHTYSRLAVSFTDEWHPAEHRHHGFSLENYKHHVYSTLFYGAETGFGFSESSSG